MTPSSLVFIAIIAIWAVFLVQHWARRREHTLTAASVHQFSEAMRVIDARGPIPRADLAASTHELATEQGAGELGVRGSTPLVARPASQAPRVVATSAAARLGATARVAEQSAAPVDGGRVTLGTSGRLMQGTSIERRGMAFLSASAWVPVSLIFVVLGKLPALTLLASLAMWVGVVHWLRVELRNDRAQRALASANAGARETSVSRPVARPVASKREDLAKPFDGMSGQTASRDDQVTASVPAAGAAEETEVAAEAAPGSWNPVPVPRPTYTLKAQARAPRMVSDGALPADIFDTPEFAEEAEDLDAQAQLARRAASL